MGSEGALERYRRRLDETRRWRETQGYDTLWARLIDLYAGKQFEGLSASDRIAVNVAFATVNVIYPSTTVNYPKLNLTARDPDENDKAIIAGAVMDYLWRSETISAGDEFRLAVKDFLMVGHGWVKTGWRFVERERARSTQSMDAEYDQARAQADSAAVESPELAGDMPTDEDIRGSIASTEQVVVEDRVFVERVSPFDVFVDPEATTTRNMKWIAQRVIRPIEEVKADPRYDLAARRKVQSDRSAKFSPDTNRRKPNVDSERVTVWEFYDLSKQTMCVFSERGDGYLVEPTKMPYKVGQPFIMIRNYDVPDQFYPMGDLEAIEPLQHELNRTRSQLMNARKTYVRKYLADEAFLSPAARTALSSNVDGEVVPINTNNGQVRLDQIIMPAPINQMPADLFGYGEMVQSDIQGVSGVSEYQRGGAAEIRRTATEASMIQDAVNARSADKLATVEKAIARIGRNMLNLSRQFLTGEHVARITGNHGLPIWVPYSQEDIDVDADFEVEGGSTTPRDESWKMNQAMQMSQALGPFVGQVVDPHQFARFILQSFGVKNADKFLMQPPPALGGPPGMDPSQPPVGMPEQFAQAPPDAMPADIPHEDAPPPMVPDPGAGLDPAMLAQLAGQVGLQIPNP